jgi:hypothetical protein
VIKVSSACLNATKLQHRIATFSALRSCSIAEALHSPCALLAPSLRRLQPRSD